MSSAAWIFAGLLVIGPFYSTLGFEDESNVAKSRQRRSLWDLKDMVTSVTGRNGEDFVNYGNWCGLGAISCIYLRRKELEMSSAAWIFAGLLVIGPFYSTLGFEDESNVAKSRQRRSLWDLKDMVTSVTGRNGEDFVNYGNWCGLGGSGDPVDAIDECCRNHDFCYDLSTRGACKKNGKKGVYNLEYKWRVADDGTAVCKDEKDECKLEICFCDALITNCLKSNIGAFDPDNQHELDVFEMLEAANWISS